MPAPCSGMRYRGTTLRVVRVGADGVRVDVAVPDLLVPVRPSQFFMVRRADGAGPFLARPFSLYLRRETPGGGAELSFLLKVIGPGTRALSELHAGDPVDLTGPLGNGFPAVKRGMRIVCVAGGVGIATFPPVFETAIAQGADPQDLYLCFGAGRADLLYELSRYESYGIHVSTATDDGSAGIRGNALDLLKGIVARGGAPITVFTCGPDRMLDAVADYCVKNQIPCHLSLETRMGCGTGVCNACAVAVHPECNGGWPVAKACREGPVFEARTLQISHS